MFTQSNTLKQKKFENYKKEQVQAIAEWMINVIQQEIPRINAIREAAINGKHFLEKQLLKNVLVYGDNVDLPFNKLTIEKQEKFKQVFTQAVWNVCETDSLQNMMDHIHISCIPGEGCPEIQKALYNALAAASISKDILENMFIGCYMMKNGKVDAYVKIGWASPGICKDLCDASAESQLKLN